MNQSIVMKNIFIVLIFGIFAFSCNSSKTAMNTQDQIWESGISMLTGEIIAVKDQKTSQEIVLKTADGTTYNCLVSTVDLQENQHQYRVFKTGENISFKGNLSSDNQMIVREILEHF